MFKIKEELLRNKVLTFFCLMVSGIVLYTATFGVFTAMVQRSLVLGLTLTISFLLKPLWRGRLLFLDWALAFLGIIATMYYVINADAMVGRQGIPKNVDIAIGIILILLIFEMGRRSIGWALPGIALIFVIYGFLGPYMPGILSHKGYSLERVINVQTLSTQGLFSVPIDVFATISFLYVLLGQLFTASKIDIFFKELAEAVVGRRIGGPALIAVVSSALMGTMSGSATANVVTVGSFTIPMMRGTGYPSYYAAAVEAAASTGGQIMPPVMGAAAFIMAEYIGVPYSHIVVAAAIPAVLYFFSIGMQVWMRSKKMELMRLPDESELPSLRKVLVNKGHLLIPLIVLVYAIMILQVSPARAGVWTIGATIFSSMIRRYTRISFHDFIRSLIQAAKVAVPIGAACALAGLVVGSVNLTGLGLRLSAVIVSASGGNFLICLVLTMISSLILGMGLPTSAAYILLAVTIAPALVRMGADTMSTHLFIFYFGAISSITPPNALASFAAAGLTGDNPMKVGWIAFKLAIAAFLVPFMFMYSPGLLAKGSVFEVGVAVLTAIIGVTALACCVEMWCIGKLKYWQALLLGISAILMIYQGLITDSIGLGIFVLVIILKLRSRTRQVFTKNEDKKVVKGNIAS